MARRPDADLATRCRALLVSQEERDANHAPISIASVARALRCTRQTLYNRKLDTEIAEAGRRQRLRSARVAHADRESPVDRLTRQRVDAETRNRALVQERAIIEYNAMRVGIDPEELRRAIPDADRSVSRAGSPRRRSRRSH